MAVMKVEVGQSRGLADGSRRYTSVSMTFDTRSMLLTEFATTGPEVEPETAELNRKNQARMREALIHEFGAAEYEHKIRNFADLGPAPWSVAGLHNTFVTQCRNAFVAGNYYPSLVGACALGERILNHLVLTLRDDYEHHPATRHVAGKEAIGDWRKCIRTLEEWGVLGEDVKREYLDLERSRQRAVHYGADLDTGDAREAALEALRLLAGVVQKIFNPHATGPHFFTGPIGRSYVRRESEEDPFIRRFILPTCVLVSPRFRFVASGPGFDVYDDPEYGTNEPPLSDDEYADPSRATPQVEYPF